VNNVNVMSVSLKKLLIKHVLKLKLKHWQKSNELNVKSKKLKKQNVKNVKLLNVKHA
jgi:hypothetical protein